MFNLGDTVVYGVQGICEYKGTTTMPVGKEAREYFVLAPIFDARSTIYVPTDNENLIKNIRPILSKEEIDSLIKTAAQDAPKWIENDLERRDYCIEIIKRGDRQELMQLISMLYLHQRDLKQTKKHFHISDERFLREAERLINEEFSYVLGISRGEVPKYISDKIEG